LFIIHVEKDDLAICHQGNQTNAFLTTQDMFCTYKFESSLYPPPLTIISLSGRSHAKFLWIGVFQTLLSGTEWWCALKESNLRRQCQCFFGFPIERILISVNTPSHKKVEKISHKNSHFDQHSFMTVFLWIFTCCLIRCGSVDFFFDKPQSQF